MTFLRAALPPVVAVLVAACSSSSPSPAAGDASADAGGTHACAYPDGPYRKQVGSTLDPSLTWQGFALGANDPTTVKVTDFYDCDGTKGVSALLLDESATWCGECQVEAMKLAPLASGDWVQQGVAWVTLMYQEQLDQPATTSTALAWRNQFGLSHSTVCADPQWTLESYGIDPSSGAVNGFPTNAVVDPRTMRIVAVQPADVAATIATLVQQNAKP
jgi:hypothetical protein